MKLSICIPTFNRNKSLEKCVRSLNKIKKQKKIKINIIIVDNSKNKNVFGSTAFVRVEDHSPSSHHQETKTHESLP